MLSKILSGTTVGLEGMQIEVEVDVAGRGFPTFTVVGLPGKAVDEAKDRVRTAITNTSFDMPDSRITVNLAPADLPKLGSGYDLPIAIGILSASGFVDKNAQNKSLFVGELSLEGNVKKVPGLLSITVMAKRNGIEKLYVPLANAQEASLVEDIDIYPVSTLSNLVMHLNGQKPIEPYQSFGSFEETALQVVDFKEIKGQEQVKRVMEIAAAGFHNVHLKGPPGTGKTLLSRAFPSILPPMSRREIVEVSQIYSVAGLLKDKWYVSVRPFRAPHHTTSRVGLIGGGSNPTPGEISLSHRGVLFLDEFPEFPTSVLESLRQPLEDGIVTISRAAGSVTYPSRFLLVAASNPCPCGYFGHATRQCKCLPGVITKYQKRISGPLLDRIDLHATVPSISHEKLTESTFAESSEQIQSRVVKAVGRQRKRFSDLAIEANGEMTSAHIRQFCVITSEAKEFLGQAVDKMSLSARSYYKVIKVAQTIADLDESYEILLPHIAEALQYRKTE